MAKKPASITLEKFMAEAEAFALTGPGLSLALAPKKFKSGSYGWGVDGGTRVTIVTKAGTPVTCIASVNLTVAGSNPNNE